MRLFGFEITRVTPPPATEDTLLEDAQRILSRLLAGLSASRRTLVDAGILSERRWNRAVRLLSMADVVETRGNTLTLIDSDPISAHLALMRTRDQIAEGVQRGRFVPPW